MPSLTFYPLGPNVKKLRPSNLDNLAETSLKLDPGKNLVLSAVAFLGRSGTGSNDP